MSSVRHVHLCGTYLHLLPYMHVHAHITHAEVHVTKMKRFNHGMNTSKNACILQATGKKWVFHTHTDSKKELSSTFTLEEVVF